MGSIICEKLHWTHPWREWVQFFCWKDKGGIPFCVGYEGVVLTINATKCPQLACSAALYFFRPNMNQTTPWQMFFSMCITCSVCGINKCCHINDIPVCIRVASSTFKMTCSRATTPNTPYHWMSHGIGNQAPRLCLWPSSCQFWYYYG